MVAALLSSSADRNSLPINRRNYCLADSLRRCKDTVRWGMNRKKYLLWRYPQLRYDGVRAYSSGFPKCERPWRMAGLIRGGRRRRQTVMSDRYSSFSIFMGCSNIVLNSILEAVNHDERSQKRLLRSSHNHQIIYSWLHLPGLDYPLVF